jgi:hypothetical protein
MKVTQWILRTFATITVIIPLALTGTINSDSTRMAAVAQLLQRNQNPAKMCRENNLIKPITFQNNIPDLLKLQEEFGNNPDKLQEFLEGFSFTINGNEIPPYQEKVILVRKDKPFTFGITAKRGKIASSVALVKALISTRMTNLKESFTDQIKNACTKLLDVVSINIKYDCPLEEHNLDNNVQYMDELLFKQEEFVSVFKQINFSTLWNWAKKHIDWPDGFSVSFKLPQLKKDA